MELRLLARLALPLIASAWATSASATLVMEPVIGFFPGTGPSADSFPLYDPTYINGATGEQVSIALHPGEIDSWSMGYPREEFMVSFGMYNNTPYDLTSFTMRMVGKSDEIVLGASWLVTPDPNVDARFGDVNGDGKIGLSDTFMTITVSNDGRTLTLSDGLIPAEGHFTDYLLSMTTDNMPFTVAMEGTFDGVFVPEPATWLLLASGFGAAWTVRRWTGRSGRGSRFST